MQNNCKGLRISENFICLCLHHLDLSRLGLGLGLGLCCLTCMAMLFLNLQITRSDIRPHIKWVVSLVIAHGHFFLSPGFVWVCMSKQTHSGEGIVALYAAPNPVLLKTVRIVIPPASSGCDCIRSETKVQKHKCRVPVIFI